MYRLYRIKQNDSEKEGDRNQNIAKRGGKGREGGGRRREKGGVWRREVEEEKDGKSGERWENEWEKISKYRTFFVIFKGFIGFFKQTFFI